MSATEEKVFTPRDRRPDEDDDTARLQEAIDAAVAANGTVVLPAGKFEVQS